ncbi:MAG: hypothetical protein ABR543_07080 [Gemmatimonadaceae bacterium]
MFEKLRQTVREAMSHASSPNDRRAVVQLMREALVEARVGVAAISAALDSTRKQLVVQRGELETVQRRGRMAAEINDRETVKIAAQYERRHLERIEVLERKVVAQEAELVLARREMEEMNSQLKAASAGIGFAEPARVEEPATPGPNADDGLRREMDRSAREAEAARQLDEMKRRMGK